MSDGIDDLTFYEEDSREELIDSDELTPQEAAFMRGWEDSGENAVIEDKEEPDFEE